MRAARRPTAAVTAALALALLGAGLAAGLRDASGESTAPGPVTLTLDRPAPDLVGSTLDGSRFDLTDYRGSVVVINVWASWCAPCRTELPLLAGAARTWSADGVVVVGLNVRDSAEAAQALLDEAEATNLITVADPTGAVAVSWGVRGVPETFVIDRSGRLRLWAQGIIDAVWLRERLGPMVQP
ncbi:MAG: TlpA family protein disulfide reductase [Micromonosporaceae bacterium]|nr:TlpA family protein disulfide reductase [Micromonosporaceae bacterium]